MDTWAASNRFYHPVLFPIFPIIQAPILRADLCWNLIVFLLNPAFLWLILKHSLREVPFTITRNFSYNVSRELFSYIWQKKVITIKTELWLNKWVNLDIQCLISFEFITKHSLLPINLIKFLVEWTGCHEQMIEIVWCLCTHICSC